jgi:hypothetical protein
VPGRIPWRDVRLWARHYEMTGDQFEFLDRCVRAMDDAFCEWHAARAAMDRK